MKNDKEEKENRLLNTAFRLFTEKGIKETSIQEIVDNASVAKGTFYLYFRDKYEIRDILIVKKSQKLFEDSLKSLRKNYISDFSDSIIYIINYVIDELTKNPLLLKFISKNLSWGVYNKAVLNIYDKTGNDTNNELTLHDLFINGIKENNIKLSNPDVTLFMIIELVGSTCFNSILYKEPLPIEEFNKIRRMIFIVGSTKFVYFVLLLFLLLLYFHEQKKLLDLLMGLLKLEQSLSLLQVLNPIAFFLYFLYILYSLFSHIHLMVIYLMLLFFPF